MKIFATRSICKIVNVLMISAALFCLSPALAQDKEFDPYTFDPNSIPAQAFEREVRDRPLNSDAPIAAQSSSGVVKPATVNFDLSALSFLKGDWRGDNDGLIFEESWSDARGGVMTAMARGMRGNSLAVLEYIVVEMTTDGPVLRFKHFNADYSNWDGEETPVTLSLVRARVNDVVFLSQEPSAVVQRLHYFMNAEGQLQTDISLLRSGKTDMFSLKFDRLSR